MLRLDAKRGDAADGGGGGGEEEGGAAAAAFEVVDAGALRRGTARHPFLAGRGAPPERRGKAAALRILLITVLCAYPKCLATSLIEQPERTMRTASRRTPGVAKKTKPGFTARLSAVKPVTSRAAASACCRTRPASTRT